MAGMRKLPIGSDDRAPWVSFGHVQYQPNLDIDIRTYCIYNSLSMIREFARPPR